MKQRTLQTDADLKKASNDLLGLGGHLPVVVTITKGKRIRSETQNARYWAGLNQHMENISNWVQKLADDSGHTPWEIRQAIASELAPEYAAIMYCFIPEAVHVILKKICEVPTSTRLGTKEFMQFETRMEQAMAEIVGEIQKTAMAMGVAA